MINGLVLSISVIDTLIEVVKILWSISPVYAVLCVLVCIVWIFATILGIMGMKEAEKNHLITLTKRPRHVVSRLPSAAKIFAVPARASAACPPWGGRRRASSVYPRAAAAGSAG